MNKLIINALVATCLWLGLVSCAGSSEGFATWVLQKMDVNDYFELPAQIDLIKAAERGDSEQVRLAIGRGADVDKVGRNGMTPLFWLFSKQILEGFTLLLEHGANANIVVDLPDDFDERRAGAMEMAARIKNTKYLQALLEHGGNPNLLLNDGNEPVIYRAIMYRRLDNVKLLLAYDANINHQDNAQLTPLNQAVTAKLYEIALYLLRAGADPLIKNRWGYSPVDQVIKYGDRGIDTRTKDLAAYDEFIAELMTRGHLKEVPQSFR